MSGLMTLIDLPGRINAEHTRCVAAAADAVAGAIEVGRLLAEAKTQVAHGQWSTWVETNCRFKMRQAQSYLKAFRSRDQIEANTQRASHLSLRGALDALPEAESEKLPYTPFMKWKPEQRQWLCREWWSDRSCYTLMLDAAGWSVPDIAQFIGQPVIAIEAILDPKPPLRFDSYENGLFIDADVAFLANWYNDDVYRNIDGMLANSYKHAVNACGPNGFCSVRPILEAGHRRHHRRWEAKKPPCHAHSCSINDNAGRGLGYLLNACTISDFRWAVRCGSETEDGSSPRSLQEIWLAVEAEIPAAIERYEVMMAKYG
jgi:Protein of unknown function (DUF3102)